LLWRARRQADGIEVEEQRANQAPRYAFVGARGCDLAAIGVQDQVFLEGALPGLDEALVERQVPHSTALHASLAGRSPYPVGPLARFALNVDRLSLVARRAATDAGLEATCRNPFRSIVVRAVETPYACDEAPRLVDGYQELDRHGGPVEPRADVGYGCTKALRASSITVTASTSAA